MKTLPVLISIAHGGAEIPAEIRDRVGISPRDLFADGDACTRDIYGIRESVAAYVDTIYARAFIDLNRDTNDLPPENPDGVVKSGTCHGKSIYLPGRELSPQDIGTLLEKYYHPYHQTIRRELDRHPEIQLALDCHSMEPIGPAIAPDRGLIRPVICLGTNRGKSCPDSLAHELVRCFRAAFQLEASEITLDRPFAGGHITRTYGNRPVPWVQVEMNRNLYLAEPWFDPTHLTVEKTRLNELRQKFKAALALLFGP